MPRHGRWLALGMILCGAPAVAAPAGWVAAFGSSPIGYEPQIRDAPPGPLHDQTVRQVVRVPATASAMRVRLTNELGTAPLRIGAATLAQVDAGGLVIAGTRRPLLFNGSQGVIIPPGAPMLSDAVTATIEGEGDWAVTLYLPDEVRPAGHADMVELATGDQTGRDTLTDATRARTAGLVSGVEVVARPDTRVLVTFGDSITEGAASTPGAHKSWPDQLGTLLRAQPAGRCWAISNAGISGNRLLHDGRGPNALARFDRDVLSVAGATTVVLLEGINDIGAGTMAGHEAEGVGADQIIAALRELVDRAHGAGLRVIGGTLLPYVGAGYADAAGEAKRSAVNRWIRGSGAFDAVIDFDAAMRDPARSDRMIPEGDSGDHLHPNDAGYARMATAALPTLLREGCPGG